MHPYLPYLLTDIKAAYRCDQEWEYWLSQPVEEQMESAALFPGHSVGREFGYYCGLSKDDFPPVQQLLEKEIKLVYDAFQKMMETWHLVIFLPKKLPWPFRYRLMVKTLDKKISLLDRGDLVFDFCAGDAPNCPLGHYCPCLEFWGDEE